MSIREKLDKLEMCDEESKGCSVCLGEMMSEENVDILEEFIEEIFDNLIK